MFKTHFDSFVCANDYITCEVDGIEYRARLEHDWDSTPHDFDCYGPRKIKRWEENDWFYFTVVISAHAEGVELGDYLACLSGIEGNMSKTGNKYFKTVANELLSEAQSEAEATLAKLTALRVAA